MDGTALTNANMRAALSLCSRTMVSMGRLVDVANTTTSANTHSLTQMWGVVFTCQRELQTRKARVAGDSSFKKRKESGSARLPTCFDDTVPSDRVRVAGL